MQIFQKPVPWLLKNNNRQNQFFWATKNEHPKQTIFFFNENCWSATSPVPGLPLAPPWKWAWTQAGKGRASLFSLLGSGPFSGRGKREFRNRTSQQPASGHCYLGSYPSYAPYKIGASPLKILASFSGEVMVKHLKSIMIFRIWIPSPSCLTSWTFPKLGFNDEKVQENVDEKPEIHW